MGLYSDSIDEFYSYYERVVSPIVNRHGKERKGALKSALKTYAFISFVCILLCLFFKSFLPVIPALFLAIFFFIKERKRLENLGSADIFSKSVKFIGADLSFKGVPGVSRSLGRTGFYPQTNSEETFSSVQGAFGGASFAVSFLEGRKVRSLPLDNFISGGLVVIIYIAVFSNLFSVIFSFDHFSGLFGAAMGIVVAYCHLGKYPGILLKKEVLFRGIFASVDFSRNFYGRTYVYSKYDALGNLRSPDIAGLQALHKGDFKTDDFVIYSLAIQDAGRILSEDMLRALSHIKSELNAPVDFVFKDTNLYVLVPMDYLPDMAVFQSEDPFGHVAVYYMETARVFKAVESSGIGKLLVS